MLCVATLRRVFYAPALAIIVALAVALPLTFWANTTYQKRQYYGFTPLVVLGTIAAFGIVLVGAIAFAALVNRAAPLPAMKHGWECHGCGHRWEDGREYDTPDSPVHKHSGRHTAG